MCERGDMEMAIGQKIRQARENLNMSQQELARKIRVGPTTVEKYEVGLLRPDTQTILTICTVLDIPASVLLEQDYQSHLSTMDHEMEQLIREMGPDKAKLILKMARDLTEEEILDLMKVPK